MPTGPGRRDVTPLPDLLHGRSRAGPARQQRPVYVDLLPPCNAGCPAGENIQAWLAHAETGDHEGAWRQLVADNPLPAIHGRVCYHPCESVCNRASLDSAVSIHSVERFLGTTSDVSLPVIFSGAEYIGKLFQVQFSLPSISTNDLPSYLTAIAKNGDFDKAQLQDFEKNVRPHFRCLEGEGSINPREIKRLINTYTLQLKMLNPRLADSLNPHVVLALVCMNFRPDWNTIYAHLAADPNLFQRTMNRELEHTEWPTSVYLSGERLSLSHKLIEYLRGDGAPVLTDRNLPLYVSAAESTWSTDPSVLDARTTVSQLRQLVADLSSGEQKPAEASGQITSELERLLRLVSSRRDLLGRPGVLREQIQSAVSELGGLTQELVGAAADESPGREQFVKDWVAKTTEPLDRLDADLKEMHRYVSVGGY